MFIAVFQCLNICCRFQFFVSASKAEMRREGDGNVAVEYIEMKTQMDLKSKSVKSISISMVKAKSGQRVKTFSMLNKRNEPI